MVNESELEILRKYKGEGWRVITKGWPDFACIKADNGEITDFSFVEVKSGSAPLTREQEVIRKILERCGKYVIERVPAYSNPNKSPVIKVSDETKRRLDEAGHSGQSYDGIISELLDHLKKPKGN